MFTPNSEEYRKFMVSSKDAYEVSNLSLKSEKEFLSSLSIFTDFFQPYFC